MIFAVLSPIPKHTNLVRELGVAGRDRPALAVGAKILAGIKAEACHIANAAHRMPFVFRSVRLGGIFDYDQPVPPRHFHDGIHVGGLAVEMYGKDCSGTSRNRFLDCTWVDRERRWINVE